MSETTFLKTVLFGGYDRTEVEQEIERLNTELFRLQNELSDHHKLIAELQHGGSETNALQRIIEEQRTALAQIQAQQELYSEKIRSFETECSEKDKEIEKLKKKITSLKDHLHEKEMKVAAYEADEDNKPARAAIAQVEEKAHNILHAAQKESAQLEENSRKLSENLIADANNTARKIVYEANVESAKLLADAQNLSSETEVASGNLRAFLLSDIERLTVQMQAIQQNFEQFRKQSTQSIGDAVQLLSSTDQILKSGGIPVFRTPHTVQPKLPSAPQYTEVSHSYPETESDSQPQEQKNAELERLQQMANAIAGSVSSKEKDQPKPAKNTTIPDGKQGVPDLAALAAQADAIVNGKK